MIVGVLVELANKNIDKVFDYKVPSYLEDKIKKGIRVSVPFGRQLLEGFVLEIKNVSDYTAELKEIIEVKDDDIVLNEELLNLGKKLSEDTLATLISCYQVMLPKALKAKEGRTISKKMGVFYRINKKQDITLLKLNEKQKEIIKLCQKKDLVARDELVKISSSSLKTLLKKNIIIGEEKELYRLEYNNEIEEKKELTSEQKKVVEDILNDLENDVFLIHGVTGSGKTEVYMELIEEALQKGKTSIVLVPEISLTPQMVNRFQKRFGNKIAAIHSALSDGEKYDEWRRIARGEALIVIGARSAIFAPVENIGIIIIDEEHSESYKQSDANPRYNAKDVAIIRSKYHKCKVVLGSATPSLETYARALKGVFKLEVLPHRVNGKQLPKVIIVDMNKEMRHGRGYFSEILLNSIEERLEKGEQIILLLNRRGYASFVTCKNCGYTFKCPNCDITLTYHKSSNTLRCHYCGYGEKVYSNCPSCHEKSLSNLGTGTQKIEEQLQEKFTRAKILRMDYDTTSRKGMHEKMIQAFKNHEYDILLGTQIVAKGLDFEDVTLVGVINADTGLNIPDFRSSENTFSLLAQVAGRSGRSAKSGEVIIQTFNPEHYAISYTKNHDYIGFYKKEMSFRKELKYPPYYYLVNVKVSGREENYVLGEALKIKKSLERNLQNTIILGPSGAMIFKVNNIYRYNLILKYKREENLKEILEKIIEHYKSNVKIKVDIDFNPSQML